MNHWAHETAITDQGAQIGEATKIWHFSHVCGGARIGKACSLGQNVFVGNDVKIGNNVKIQNNVSIYDAVEIEDDVFCGPSMVFTNVINPRSHVIRKHEYKKTYVRKGASIGANATIVCGVELGQYCFVAAGAVVTKNVKAFSLVAGVPAKHLYWVCQCGEKLPQQLGEVSCASCGNLFEITNESCRWRSQLGKET